MAHKKTLFLAVFVALASFTPAYGLEESKTTDTTTETKTETQSSETKTASESPTTKMTPEQKTKVEVHKTELKQRIETVKTARVETLKEKRLETCEKRQSRVNAIFTKATEQNKKQLAVFQKIEERVKAFYVAKSLTAEGYEAAAATADEKEAAAVAAVEVSSTVSFDCASTDATKPGGAIKEAMSSRHTALKEYRTAIKNLILVVKKHHGQQTNTADKTTETETTSEGER